MAAAGEITALLAAVRHGDTDAESRLLSLVYEELNGLAQRHMRGERAGHTLQPTALVNEAYIRLMGGDHKNWVRFRQACVSREDGAAEWRELWEASPHTCRFHSGEEFVPFDVIACSSGPPAGKGLLE